MMKKTIVLIFATLVASVECYAIDGGAAAATALSKLLATVTIEENSQIANAVNITKNLKEELEIVRDVYKVVANIMQFADTALNLADCESQTTATFKAYTGALSDIANSKVVLKSDEVEYMVGIMNVATFGAQKTSNIRVDDVAGGAIGELKQVFNAIKNSKSDEEGVSVLEITEYIKDIKQDINDCYLTTIACRRYVQCLIAEAEQDAGIYDTQKAYENLKTKLKKL